MTALAPEARDDSMKNRSSVSEAFFSCAEGSEVFNCVGNSILVERDDDSTCGLVTNSHVKVDSWINHFKFLQIRFELKFNLTYLRLLQSFLVNFGILSQLPEQGIQLQYQMIQNTSKQYFSLNRNSRQIIRDGSFSTRKDHIQSQLFSLHIVETNINIQTMLRKLHATYIHQKIPDFYAYFFLKPFNQQLQVKKTSELYFQNQRHRNIDQKRDDLIKLISLVTLGLIVIVIILVLKSCFPKKITQNNTSNVLNQSIKQEHLSVNTVAITQRQQNSQRIVLDQNYVKLETMKDRFLRKQISSQANNINIIASQQSQQPKQQSQPNTPTFGGDNFCNQV